MTDADDDDGANERNTAMWTITPPARTEMVGNQDSSDSPDSCGARRDELTSHTSHEYGPSQDVRCRGCGKPRPINPNTRCCATCTDQGGTP